MKNFIKKTLSFFRLLGLAQKINQRIGNDIFPKIFLKVSLNLFKKKYDRYWASVKSDISLTDMKKPFKDLKENGYARIDSLYSKAEISQITREVKKLKGFDVGIYKGNGKFSYKNFVNDGICALGISQDFKSCYKYFTQDKRLLNLAKALYGKNMKLSASSLLCKYGKDKIDSSNVPHWDDWKIRLKVFILLNEVKMANAPMIYFKGSHKKNIPWRLEKDYSSVFLSYEASAGGSWWPVENLNLDKVYFTGKPGTCYIFDATGIHTGTQLRSGKRLMLMNMYTNHLDFTYRAY